MDGFDSSTGVIVIAATNRPDVLDAALLRPGRFDRRVAVQPPDRTGRKQILEVHTKKVPLAPDVDLGRIASQTPGMVGADLANLVNEAALLAARRNHEQVNESDFTDALERIVLGAERQVMISREDRSRTAYHEGGHAVVGMLTEGADPVRKISIIPRGMALGVTFSAPEADRFNYSKNELIARIKVALGGRAAEEVVYGDASTGAESDIAAAHPDRPPHGRPLGDERGDRPARGAPARRRRVLPRRLGDLGADAGADRQRGAADRRAGARTRWSRCSPRTATSSTRSRTRCSSTRRSTRTTRTPPPESRTRRRPPREPRGRRATETG